MRISRFIRCTCVKSMAAMLIVLWLLIASAPTMAHGFAAKRFFPTTFTVEDPFVSDEFSILGSHIAVCGLKAGCCRAPSRPTCASVPWDLAHRDHQLPVLGPWCRLAGRSMRAGARSPGRHRYRRQGYCRCQKRPQKKASAPCHHHRLCR